MGSCTTAHAVAAIQHLSNSCEPDLLRTFPSSRVSFQTLSSLPHVSWTVARTLRRCLTGMRIKYMGLSYKHILIFSVTSARSFGLEKNAVFFIDRCRKKTIGSCPLEWDTHVQTFRMLYCVKVRNTEYFRRQGYPTSIRQVLSQAALNPVNSERHPITSHAHYSDTCSDRGDGALLLQVDSYPWRSPRHTF